MTISQLHSFFIRCVVALHILCFFYEIEDSVGLIHATHTLKRSQYFYFLSPKPYENVNFISHQCIDKDFQKS